MPVITNAKFGPLDVYRELELISDDPSAVVDREELAAQVSAPGRSVSARRIASLIQEGLIPQSVRVGSGRGVWPVATVDLVRWVLLRQERGFSNRAVRELVPAYVVMNRSLATGCMDLAEIEEVARSEISDPEANAFLPTLVSETLSFLHRDDRGWLTWRLKDGTELTGEAAESLIVTFLMTEPDPSTGVAHPTSFAQLKLPGMDVPELGAPDVIILGSPPDMPVEYQNVREMRRVRRHDRRSNHQAHTLPFRASAGS